MNDRRTGIQPASEAQLMAVAMDYVHTMRNRGVEIDASGEAMVLRSAAIQDAWRCAFARVLGSHLPMEEM